ncbi:hypothetical protein FB451DRAFT_1489972 [Mycena latifolia]|nr:hypothetical protein FB451DRAFT_1489972 [Mycena latifolia]
MAQDLPPELIDCVVRELKMPDPAEKRTVADCGLVCRTWLPSSRYHFFSEVYLNNDNSRSFLSAVETSCFDITSFIRFLDLAFRPDSEGELPAALREICPLLQVTTLRISMDPPLLAQHSFATSFPNISTLVLYGYGTQFPLNSVLDVIASFRTLKSFEARDIGLLRVSEDPLPSGYQFPPQCRALTLDFLADRTDSLFKDILSLHSIPIFSSLMVRDIHSTFFHQYISYVGHQLQYLRFNFGLQSNLTWLRSSTGLRRLDLGFGYYTNIPRQLLALLPCLNSSHLDTINVVDNNVNDQTQTLQQLQWGLLDQALAEERFSRLRAFPIQTRSQELATRLPKLMPLSEAHGILRIVAASVHCRCSRELIIYGCRCTDIDL